MFFPVLCLLFVNIFTDLAASFAHAHREGRKSFIRSKYIDREYVVKSSNPAQAVAENLKSAILFCDFQSLLEIYAEEADLSVTLPDYVRVRSLVVRALLLVTLSALIISFRYLKW